MQDAKESRLWHVYAPACIFAGVLFLRLLVLLRLSDSPLLFPGSGDTQFYNSWALRILHGQWTDHVAFYGLPLYPYLLAGIYKCAGYNPFVPGVIQAAVDAATAIVLYKISACIFQFEDERENHVLCSLGGKAIGLLAALGWCFFQPAEAYAVILMPTSLAVFVFWFVVWQIVRTDEAPRKPVLFSLGILIGVTAMAIATVLLLVPLIIAATFLRWKSRARDRVQCLALLFVAVILGTSPAWTHNYFVARDPVFLSAHSGVNFWIGNNPVATGYPKFPPGLHAGQSAMLADSISVPEKAAGHSLRRSEVSAYWSSQARNWIARHPALWLRLLGGKFVNFWNAFQYDDLSVVTTLRDQLVIFPGLSYGVIAALGMAGMVIAWFRVRLSRWITGAIFLQLFSLLSVFVTERYRMAAVPGLLIFAAYGMTELWLSLSLGSVKKVAAYLILLFGATGFVSLPQKDKSLWALDSYNSGLQAYDCGNLALAKQKLDLAYRYSPCNSQINLAEGNVRFALGDTAAAEKFYLAALRLDPANESIYNNLAVIALTESRWHVAADLFTIVLRQNPKDAKAHYLLACARYHERDVDGAERELAQACALAPDQPEFRRLQKQLDNSAARR